MSSAGYLILSVGIFLLGVSLLNNKNKSSISKSEFMTFCNIQHNLIRVKRCPYIDSDIINKIKIDCPEYYFSAAGLKKNYFNNDSVLILNYVFEFDSSKTRTYSSGLILCDSINVYQINKQQNKLVPVFPINSIKSVYIIFKKTKKR